MHLGVCKASEPAFCLSILEAFADSLLPPSKYRSRSHCINVVILLSKCIQHVLHGAADRNAKVPE